jgi:hypothetical protein
MASNSPKYPRMNEWQLRLHSDGGAYTKVYGPPHPVDGGNYSALFETTDREFAEEVVRRWNAVPPSAPAGASEETASAKMHMFVWLGAPMFLAVAQARSVAEARELLLDEIGAGSDGSCPERERAAKFVKEKGPSIWHGPNAEFALTDSAEVRELEVNWKKAEDELKRLRAAPSPAPSTDRAGELLFDLEALQKECRSYEGAGFQYAARRLDEILSSVKKGYAPAAPPADKSASAEDGK